MAETLQSYLELALQRLEKVYEEVLSTQGYSAETEKLKMLLELTREQVENENFNSAAR